MNDFYCNDLFSGISRCEFDKMLQCFKPVEKSYGAGETVCSYDVFNDNVGIVSKGEVQIIRIDSEGNRTILENLGNNGLFGRVISFAPVYDDAVGVVCKKDCFVLFVEYRHIVKRCENACAHHSRLVENMLRLMSRRAVDLSLRVEILSQRSIRGKLMAYFKSEAQRQKSGQCKIGFSYSDLADYICVDRCAMMRELKKMREEGIIRTSGKSFAFPCR